MEERILDMLNQLAVKLGTTSEFLFEIMTKREFVSGIILSVIGGLFFIISIVITLALLKCNSKDDEGTVVAMIIALIVLIIFPVILLYKGIIGVFAPEAQAFLSIIQSLK